MKEFNPQLDLVLERTVDLSAALIWEAWTTPAHLKAWFCPKPWSVSECEMDLKPGGIFRTVMRSPEGEAFPNLGCILEVVPQRLLTWTDALLPGFRPVETPQSGADLLFTGKIMLEPLGQQTKYTALAMHKNQADQQRHAEMGFYEGWSICLDQLLEHMKGR